MKKMKVWLVAVMACLVASFVSAAGGPVVITPPVTNSGVNPLNVARAFALKTPAYYQCWLSGDMLIDGKFKWTDMSFTMRGGDFAITNLVIDGTNSIPLPQPIYGIPLGNGGLMQNVFLNVNAMTKNGEYAGSGYIQRQAVSKDDSLVVVISPAAMKQEIPVDLATYGNDISLTIDGFTYGYGYGVVDGKFYVWLPPVGGRYHYVLRRQSDGTIIGSGWVEPFKNTVTPDDAYIGVSYIGNVMGSEFPQPNGVDSWAGIPNISFDCEIPMADGSVVAGKVIFTDVGSGGLELYLGGDCWVGVYSATTATGDMLGVPLKDNGSMPGWTAVSTTGMQVGKVVITIIPKPTNQFVNPYVNLHRFYGIGGFQG